MKQLLAGKRLRGAGALVAATGLLLATAACGSSSPSASKSTSKNQTTSLHLVYDWPGMDFEAVPIVVGERQGFYKAAHLNVSIVLPPNNSTTVKMLADNKGDIGFDTTTDVVFARAAGIPIVSIANYSQNNNWGLVAPPGKKIDLKHLAGKSIGIFTDSWTKAMMPYVLKAAGVSSTAVKQDIFQSDDIAPMLAGKLDIATNTMNYAVAEVQAAVHKKPTTLLATSFGAPNVPIWVFTATQSWLASHGPEAKAFLSATKKAFAWAIAHPKAAVNEFVAAYPHTGSSKEYSYNGWLETIPAITAGGYPLLSQRASQWSQVVKALQSVHLLTKGESPSTYYTNKYLGG